MKQSGGTKFFKTRQQAYHYGRRMARASGQSFDVSQVEAGRWTGYWFAMPETPFKRLQMKNPRATARASTGDAVAAHELFLFAINESELYRSRITPVINNLRKKVRKGIYNPILALKLWRYVADDAAKRYTHGSYGRGPGYGIFTVPIREQTAKELAEYYDENLRGEGWTGEKNPIQGPGKFEGELFVTRYAHENYDEDIGDVQELGWYGKFSGKIKGRGPFHIIVTENDQGFVSGKLFDSEQEMREAWDEVVREYEKLDEERGNE